MTKNKALKHSPVRVRQDRDGSLFVILPKRVLQDFRLKVGDTVTLQPQGRQEWHLRFYRQVKRSWFQLLPGGGSCRSRAAALSRRPPQRSEGSLPAARLRKTPKHSPNYL